MNLHLHSKHRKKKKRKEKDKEWEREKREEGKGEEHEEETRSMDFEFFHACLKNPNYRMDFDIFYREFKIGNEKTESLFPPSPFIFSSYDKSLIYHT